MTPDESAWTVFIAELRKRDLLSNAGAASAALAEFRRASGAFELGLRPNQLAQDVAGAARIWMRERDEARDALLKAERRHVGRCEERDAARRDALNFQEQRDVNLALLSAARSRAEAAEKAARSAEARADASFREKTAVVVLLREALVALAVVANMPTQPLNGLVYVVDPVTRGQATDVLAKAKAAGYEP